MHAYVHLIYSLDPEVIQMWNKS